MIERVSFHACGWVAIALAAVAASTTVACREAKETEERSCAATQALTSTHFKGDSLPPKTLALTFDDGPGVRTLELSRFLFDRGVRATFFVNGKMLRGGDGPTILGGLVADGHVLGNHGESHSNLTTLPPSVIVSEVETTDALIAPFVKNGHFLFRPPYNAFDMNVFTALSASTMAKYVGPIDWDIGDSMGPQQATDWDCWQPIGTSDPPVLDVKTCGDLFLAEIRAKQRGIILMHDPYFIEDDPTKGGTVDMVKEIVPVLLADGYRFVTVDEVPAIASVLPPPTVDAGTEASAPTPAPTSAPSTTTTPPPTTTTTPPPPPPCR